MESNSSFGEEAEVAKVSEGQKSETFFCVNYSHNKWPGNYFFQEAIFVSEIP